MAFNFNWSPLIADTVRARDLLTNALNKSPKPPIIVDDIVVTELNLGTKPPDLEILEIGDLADDRFRGIFKMSYDGDAFLTLKTKVQANPLNTYLSTKPSFTSPQPLAAASGLTIPLQITLSHIKLSGFVILVFSKQKGLTIVFRNDPLESLKVSSTFDSIPFVRDYLQREIEAQLRLLFMEDLPVILHKLSLRLFVKDHAHTTDLVDNDDGSVPIDPLASPPQDPVDDLDSSTSDDGIPFMSLSIPQDSYITFSQKNLSQFSSLSNAHQTLSVATPAISQAVYRAWASKSDRGSGINTPLSGHLTRANSSYASSTCSVRTGAESEPTRPTLSSASSYSYSRSSTGGPRKKRKHRVIDLRTTRSTSTTSPAESESMTSPMTPMSPDFMPFSSSSAPSVSLGSIPEESTGNTPAKSNVWLKQNPPVNSDDTTPIASTATLIPSKFSASDTTSASVLAPAPPDYTPNVSEGESEGQRDGENSDLDYFSAKATQPLTNHHLHHLRTSSGNGIPLVRSLSADRISVTPSGGILEKAWMKKIARETARKVDEERGHQPKSKRDSLLSISSSVGEQDVEAPPAYVV